VQARLNHPSGLSPPFLPGPVPDEAFPAGDVAVSQQRRDVNVERGLGPRVGKQVMDGREGRRNRIDRAPVLARQEGQTDLARGEGDVGMGDPGGEVDGRRGLRIAGGDGDAEMPQATFIRSAPHALQDGLPVQQIIVAGGTETQQCIVRGLRVFG